MKQIQITTTLDGSHTLYVPEIDEHYHSVNGAIQESRHIFIDAALSKCSKDNIHILEIGFGTGLNALLTLLEAEKTQKNIVYTTIELYPVSEENVALLNYSGELKVDNNFFEKTHRAEWNRQEKITDNFLLEKIQGDFTSFHFEGQYDVIYFDAFSPERQPEMWSEDIFRHMYHVCNSGAVLTTYCAKGIVRRALQKAGFRVERLPGPPGKREILRASK